MANFRGAPTRYGFFHSASPPMSGGFMDQGPRQMKGEEEESPPSQNLWVGNVSADVTETMLKETFAKFGDIDNITAYPQRNYAFVYFKHIEHAIAAKEGLQGVPLGGSNLKIEFSRAAKPSKHLWIGGISQTVPKEQIEAEFLKFGPLEDFKLLRDRNSALVEYSNLEDAVSAVKFLNGKQLCGDSLRVDYLRSQPVKRESVTNSHMHTIEVRNGRFNDQRTFMGSTDLGRRNFDMLICPPEPPQSILPKVQTAHGHDGGRNQGGQSNVLWIGFPPSVKVDDQRLHNALILFGEIERIQSFPSRHHAFVEFRSVDEARRAKDGLQGRLFNDPRIQILYSNSEFMPVESTKDSATLMTPSRGMLPPDTLYRNSSQFGSNESLRPINPSNAQGINMHARPVGPWGFPEQHTIESRIPLSRSEPFHKFSNTNINSPRLGGGWNRPPSHMASGLRPLGPLPGARDGFDGNASLRESKRPRVDEAYPVAGHLDIRKLDNDATGALPGYHGTQPDRIISNYINTRNNEGNMGFRESQGSPVNGSKQVVAGPGRMQPPPPSARAGNSGGHGEHYEVVSEDWPWQGIIAKGGTPVCRARSISIGKGIDAKFPEVVNCSARTGLDKLAEHFSQASDFGLVCFLPAGGQDVHTYQEFLYYLGSKHRAGVAKFSDGTTLFLVPPSDFSENYLKVRGTDRLFGVVLKFHQLPSNSMYQNQSLRFPQEPSQQLVQRQHFPISHVDHGTMALKEDQTEYNTDIPRSFSPVHTGQIATLQSTNDLSAPQSQSTVALTPELIATISSLIPNAFQASGAGSGSLVQASSMKQGTYDYNGSNDASNSRWQVSSPRSSEIWRQHQQVPPLPSHQLISEQGTYQHPTQLKYQSSFSPVATVSMPSSNNTTEQSGQGAEVNPSFQDPNTKVHQSSMMYQTTTNELAHLASDPGKSMDLQSEQLAMPCGQERYQQEAPLNSQTSYAHMLSTGTSENIQSLVSPQQKTMTSRSSDQYQAGGGSQILPSMQVGHDEMSSELSSQVQQLQGIGAALLGHNQESSESEAEKNLRYQSTLQFAANLLQQLQQKQVANKSAMGGTQHRQ
ncbi:flowering time control protein FPA [Cryptomeria japonica]|uniref:flowering time control protein FPA n=1 Tax=Cryptomeria japonica TaxID=3369 RepID=UPI0027DAB386|nr:flowering time control protein FPA [Cryptomeria japonica]XP_057839065.2 flowering time control protein FPA [Cryptomeria japonica]XP_057839066.2 flowering time control protein FPA [Cryptomeria japonica]